MIKDANVQFPNNGLSFSELEVILGALTEKTFPSVYAPIPQDLHEDIKALTFGERYGSSSRTLESFAKELSELNGPSPDKQDAVASTCFILDSLGSLKK